MTLKVFVDLMSQPARSLMLLIKINSIEHNMVITDVAKGKHRSAEYTKIAPSRMVPAIQDGDFALFESNAILKYLCETRNLDNWYPKERRAQAKIDEYLCWHHSNLRIGAAWSFYHTMLSPMMTSKPAKDISDYLTVFKNSVYMFDNYFIKDTPYISSQTMTVADLMALTEFSQLELWSEAPKISDKIKEWRERCITETEPHYSDVHKIHSKFKKLLSAQAKL